MTNTSMTQAERQDLKKGEASLDIWLLVGDCGEDPSIPWEHGPMTMKEAQQHVLAIGDPEGPEEHRVELVHLLLPNGRSYMVIGDAEDLVAFRQFLKDRPSRPPG